MLTGFCDGFFGNYEKDDECDIYKVITTAWFDSIKSLKEAIKQMENQEWFFNLDSTILLNGTYIFCDGEWKY